MREAGLTGISEHWQKAARDDGELKGGRLGL